MLLCNLLRSFTWDKKNSEILGATNVRIFVVRMTQIRLRDVRNAWKETKTLKYLFHYMLIFLDQLLSGLWRLRGNVQKQSKTKQN